MSAGDVRMLTLQQPWATAIRDHGKRVENRSWTTRWRGPLLVHAGAGWDAAGAWDPRLLTAFGLPVTVVDGRPRPQQLLEDDVPAAHRRAVVAFARLVDVVECRPGTWPACEDRWASCDPGSHHWILSDVVPLDPVPARGGLGLLAVDEAVRAAVLAQLARRRARRVGSS